MDFVKEWCISICATLIIAVVFSLLTPKGNIGKYLKISIALFIIISFIFPLSKISNLDFDKDSFSFFDDEIQQSETYESLIETQVKTFLNENGIDGCSVDCNIRINADEEIEVKRLIVSVADEYDIKDVKNMIYDDLGYVAQVKYIGK